jgi:hypothetical protein
LLDRPRLPLKPGETLRGHRAVHVLETIGNPDARRHLQVLATGDPNAQLTRDARDALQRLKTSSNND